MASGQEVYAALRQKIGTNEIDGEFLINALEARDLAKLRISDWVNLGFDEASAEELAASLLKGDFSPLSLVLGFRLSASHDTPPLVTENLPPQAPPE